MLVTSEPRSVKIGENERTGWSSDRPRRPGAADRPPRRPDVSVRGRVLSPTDSLRYSPGSLLLIACPDATTREAFSERVLTEKGALLTLGKIRALLRGKVAAGELDAMVATVNATSATGTGGRRRVWLAGYTVVDRASGATRSRRSPSCRGRPADRRRGRRRPPPCRCARLGRRRAAAALGCDATRRTSATPMRSPSRRGRRAARLRAARARRRARAELDAARAWRSRSCASSASSPRDPRTGRDDAAAAAPRSAATDARHASDSAGATSASSPSATRRRSGSRWPQSTSRRIARRHAPSELDERLDRRLGPHDPRDDAALHRDRAAQPGDQLLALVRRRRRSPPCARTAARSRRASGSASSARAHSSQSVSASSGAPRSQPSSKRRSAQASSPRARRAAGDERAERAQRVLLLGREQAVAARRGAGRWRAGSRATAPPSVRAQAVGPSAGSASSHSRSAVCSRRSRRPACSRLGVAVALEREHGDGRVLVAAQLGRRVGERDAADERQAVAERDLVGLDHEPVDGRDDERERAARVDGLLELGVGGAKRCGSNAKSVASAHIAVEERLQRGVGLRARRRIPAGAGRARAGSPAGRAAPTSPWTAGRYEGSRASAPARSARKRCVSGR